jgi:hypothetical protein
LRSAVGLILLSVLTAAVAYLAYDPYERRAMFARFCRADAFEVSVACAALR